MKYKDPQDVQDFQWKWAERLADAETITSSTFIVPTGLTKDSDSHDTTTATVWLSGGTAGETYAVTNRVVTDQGRTWDWSERVQVRNR